MAQEQGHNAPFPAGAALVTGQTIAADGGYSA